MHVLKPYSQLNTAHRCEPCQEYPGQWHTYLDGNEEQSFSTWHEAFVNAAVRWEQAEGSEVSVCWKASDNDPRIGEVWFTPFYQDGKIGIDGIYGS